MASPNVKAAWCFAIRLLAMVRLGSLLALSFFALEMTSFSKSSYARQGETPSVAYLVILASQGKAYNNFGRNGILVSFR